MNMPSLSAYKTELDYSYAPGIFPSIECLLHRGDRVRRVLIHSSAAGREGADRLIGLAEGLKVRVGEADRALARMQERWPELRPTREKRGNGPAHYYRSAALQGCIGFVDAVSHRFCASCNRVRLTSDGKLKPCLCFDSTVDLRALLRGGCRDQELESALRDGIFRKPRAHRFDLPQEITEHRIMSQIGG
jgi:cyclic pyranopterin phosphate synthase